ncbi:hypothetical protein [Endozoicomonas acroporae]|uniref:hypothetical protein n=1 Tax=Endozoicomonas acroporae TaxID=1701104 RepID=UPI003D7A6481
MKSDSKNSLWVKTAKGTVLLEQGAVVFPDDTLVDLFAYASKAESLANGEVLDTSDSSSVFLGKPSLSGRSYPFK